MKTKKKLTEETAKKYVVASKKEKGLILAVFCVQTGYSRKYAITVLSKAAEKKQVSFNGRTRTVAKLKKRPERKKRACVPKYGEDVKKAVRTLWEYSLFLCAKRLAPFIRENIDYLARKFSYSEETKKKLSEISAATVGRILKGEIAKRRIRGRPTTRPAKNLNALVPVRVFFGWDERKPGFFEMDTVAHCGMSTAGEYLKTLTVTDVHSGWTEIRIMRNSAHRWVKEAVDDIKRSLPFELKGLDSDNGSEFKNMQMIQWCAENHVELTRSRPYRKNDNCFVGQKNDSVARRIAGYQRFEGEAALQVFKELYESYGKLVNCFFPSMKIISKTKIDAKTKKQYDGAKTPFKRLLESDCVDKETKKKLQQTKEGLDLDTLLKNTLRLQKRLMSMALPWN